MGRHRRGVRLVDERARQEVPRAARHPGELGHGRQRAGDGVRQPGRDLGHRRRLHAQSLDRREGALRRVPDQRAGRGRGRGHPHAAGHHRTARASPPARTSPRWSRPCRRLTPSCAASTASSRSTTATCRTWSSPSSSGKLWMLQTRSGKRTAKAALRIAVDLANEGLISRAEAVSRIDPGPLDQLLHPTHRPQGRAQRARDRPAGLARRGVAARSCSTPRRRRPRKKARPQSHPGARRDLARGHPRHARRARAS